MVIVPGHSPCVKRVRVGRATTPAISTTGTDWVAATSRATLALVVAIGTGLTLPRPALAQEPSFAQAQTVAFALRDLTPFALPFLGFAAAPPPPLGAHRWGLEARFSVANTYVRSPAVARYLHDRGRRDELSAGELAALAALPTDDFYFDGEVASLFLESRWAVGPHHELFVGVSALWFSGGVLDPVIEGFHSSLGLGQAGRDDAARNRFQLLLEADGRTIALTEAPTRGGLADPVLGGRWRFGSTPGWNGAIEAAVKSPIAGERPLLSSGAWDAGLQISVQRRWPVWGFGASASTVRTGRSRGALELPERDRPSFVVATSRRVGRNTEAVAQLSWTRSLFAGLVASDLADPVWLGALGLRRAAGPLVWELGFVENLESYNNSADFGLHLSVAWSPAK